MALAHAKRHVFRPPACVSAAFAPCALVRTRARTLHSASRTCLTSSARTVFVSFSWRCRAGLSCPLGARAQSSSKDPGSDAEPAAAEGESPAVEASAVDDEAQQAVESGNAEADGSINEEPDLSAADADPIEAQAYDPVQDDTTWEYERHQRRLVEREMASPAAWRDPATWVDLEFDRVGIDGAQSANDSSFVSPWGSEEFPNPDMNVMWPQAALSEHRRRPFVLPRKSAAKQSSASADAIGEESAGPLNRQLQDNRERVVALWRFSASHGISWDELDKAYVTFSQSGKKRQDEWRRRDPKGGKVHAQSEKDRSIVRASTYMKRFCPKDDPMEVYPSRTKRLASRLYTREKRRWLSPWRPGRLAHHLQELVAARMLRRETEDRVLGLRSAPS